MLPFFFFMAMTGGDELHLFLGNWETIRNMESSTNV